MESPANVRDGNEVSDSRMNNNDQHSESGYTQTDSEQRLFDIMNRYVESLQRNDEESQSALWDNHPEMCAIMKCLDQLDGFAVAGPAKDADEEAKQSLKNTEFGGYQLLEEIGRGGMGVVYRAQQRDLERDVALKMILASHLASSEDVTRFYTEARTAGRLRHPNIVGIHEVGEIAGQHFFAMDYVEGKDLSDCIREKQFSTNDIVQCMAAVAKAVHYLHQEGIVHRDLKPSNILIDSNGNPMVTDFGLAKIFDTTNDQTCSGAILGTPSYMSPEQAAGRISDISAASDIHSLGTILYQMLTGVNPFRKSRPFETLLAVMEDEPCRPRELNSKIPRALELICLRCLKKSPHQRYSSAAELAEDLDRFMRGEPVVARASTVSEKCLRWFRQQPALAIHLIGVFLTTTILQVNYTVGGVDPQFHAQIMSLLGVWAALMIVFQRLLRNPSLDVPVRYAWAAADAIMLTWLLMIADDDFGPLLAGYALLIAASGLFFRTRLVIFTTVVCIAAYTVLMIVRPSDSMPAQYPFILGAVLAVLGGITCFQVQRIRALSRFFENRRAP